MPAKQNCARARPCAPPPTSDGGRSNRARTRSVAPARRPNASSAISAASFETARVALERGQLTAPAIDTVLEPRRGSPLARAPAPAKARAPAAQRPATTTAWKVGDEAQSRSGGWTGRITELDRSKRRATIEAGSMRISVEVADLEPVGAAAASFSAAAAASVGTNVAELRLSRSRSVPMSLDLRGARVEEALAALESYLEDASLAGLAKVTVIHGLGTGALRDAVRSDASAHPLVKSARAGERGEGGDGVTVVEVG